MNSYDYILYEDFLIFEPLKGNTNTNNNQNQFTVKTVVSATGQRQRPFGTLSQKHSCT